jgi:hypothetical protein
MAGRTFPLSLIMEALDGLVDEDDVRETGYSGRGMYGNTCAGITFDSVTQSFRFFTELGRIAVAYESDDDEALEQAAGAVLDLVDAAATDSMGRGVIVYFPRWTFN